MPSRKFSTIRSNNGFLRTQDKILTWSMLALVAVIVWLYTQDRAEWKAFMQEQRALNADVSRRMELAIERHGRMREDITAQNERISRLWERYGEFRDAKK